MNRNNFILYLIAGPIAISLFVLAVDRAFQTNYFESNWLKLGLICIFLPILVYLRSCYAKWTIKEFFIALIPVYGWRKQLSLLKKP